VGRELPLTGGLVLDILESLGIDYRVHEHAEVFTVEESQEVTGSLPGAHTKNLFLKDKKGFYWLLTARDSTRVDMKLLKRYLGAKSSLSFGSSEDLYEKLGVLPGSVTPLSMVNCRDGDVGLLLDGSLFRDEIVNVHPLRNDRTVALSPLDLLIYLRFCGCKMRLLFFSEGDEE
jgi:Ala-tRNA(Pro) deacylase